MHAARAPEPPLILHLQVKSPHLGAPPWTIERVELNKGINSKGTTRALGQIARTPTEGKPHTETKQNTYNRITRTSRGSEALGAVVEASTRAVELQPVELGHGGKHCDSRVTSVTSAVLTVTRGDVNQQQDAEQSSDGPAREREMKAKGGTRASRGAPP
eukprot:scaffold20611_cov56-Phaeocystis_antarctica.AAC.2